MKANVAKLLCMADAKKAGGTSFKSIKYHQIVLQTTPADEKIKKDEVDDSGRRILTLIWIEM